MTALQFLAAWFITSIPAGLLVARFIRPTTDDRQHGEGKRVRGDVQSHGSVK